MKKEAKKIESFKSYFTIDGWKKDWQKTKEDFKNLYSPIKYIKKNKGNVFIGCLGAILFIPMCATAGALVGESGGIYLDEILNSKEYIQDICKYTGTVLGFFGGVFIGYKSTKYIHDLVEN